MQRNKTSSSKLPVIIRSVAVTLCILLVFTAAQPAYAAGAAKQSPYLYESIDRYIEQSLKKANIPAYSICIVDKDSVLFAKSYGECDSCDTPFFLGSVSKSFTAVCVMQLVERGLIDLEASISAYLPDATDGDRIKVGQLLKHTSGLGEHQTLANYHIVGEQGVHSYANVNYTLLGKIIETVSSMSYSDYIETNVFEPLGMSKTAATLERSVKNGVIDGYTNMFGVNVKREHQFPTSDNDWISVPAGYISASANDLGRYLQMFLNNGEDILTQQSIETMTGGDSVRVESDAESYYCYGIGRTEYPQLSESVILQHNGLVETGTADFYILPKSGIAVGMVANTCDTLVGQSIFERMNGGVVLMLIGQLANTIDESGYQRSHIIIDLLMLAAIAIGVTAAVSVFGITKRRKKLGSKKLTAHLIRLHVILPAVILLLPVFMDTPYWVLRTFVPDVYLATVISAALLLISGAVKVFLLVKQRKADALSDNEN